MDRYLQDISDYQIFANQVRFPRLYLYGVDNEDDDDSEIPLFTALNKHVDTVIRHIRPGNIIFAKGDGITYSGANSRKGTCLNSFCAFIFYLGRSVNPKLFYALVDNFYSLKDIRDPNNWNGVHTPRHRGGHVDWYKPYVYADDLKCQENTKTAGFNIRNIYIYKNPSMNAYGIRQICAMCYGIETISVHTFHGKIDDYGFREYPTFRSDFLTVCGDWEEECLSKKQRPPEYQ